MTEPSRDGTTYHRDDRSRPPIVEDPEVRAVLERDPVMAALIDRHELEPVGRPDEYERLVVSIVNQQLSTASANAVRLRLFDVLDGDVTPETVLATDDELLLDAGLSRQKLEYLRSTARAFLDRDLTREGLNGHSVDVVLDELTTIRGVGEWTARMYCIFVLGRRDVLPLGDLAVRRGIEACYGEGETLERTEMRDIADAWRPYRSLGTRYVWAEYESDR